MQKLIIPVVISGLEGYHMAEAEAMEPEMEMYIKRIGDMRTAGRYGRAVQLCDRALGHKPEMPILNVILNFKADSLFRVGRKTGDTALHSEARKCYLAALKNDPNDYKAKRGLEKIDFA